MFVASDTNTMQNAKPVQPASERRRVRSAIDEEMDKLREKIAARDLEIADLQASLLRMSQRALDAERAAEAEEARSQQIKRSIREICEDVLQDFPDITFDDVIGVRRTRNLIPARRACMAAVYVERKDLSTVVIGEKFKRDHTTILYAVRKAGVWDGEGGRRV